MLPAPGASLLSPTSGVRYDLGEPLGEGEFGIVFDCVAAHGRFAAKWFRNDRLDVSAHAVWKKECAFSRRLRHPNIIALEDAFESDGNHWLILERADGNLARLIEEHGPRSASEVHAMGAGLLRALAFIHDAGAIHRDIQVFNVLHASTEQGFTAKLCDFGVSTWVKDGSDGKAFSEIWGEYELVPEYYAERHVTAKSDIYQVGYVMYFALTATMPLTEADGAPEHAVPSGLARARALELALPLGDCIAGMLHPIPDMRFGTARDALACLERCQVPAP